MKIRYYLRGLGLGILFTAVFFLIGGSSKQTMSDEMIKERAKELGMIENTVLADIDSDKRYISATNVMVQSPADYKVLNFVDVSDAENIANAKFFVAGKQGFYMFYAVDNKLYKLTCKMQESQDYSSELVMEYPAGTEITAMKGYNYGNTLVLGVYDSAAQESKLYIYNADETTGVLTEPEVNGYTIYGKIKGFGLKQW